MTTVLLAEDNIMVAMMMQLDLEQAGYKVLGPFARTEEALRSASKEVDLALVDIDLAGGDRGTDLATKLTGEFSIPCLFVTGQAEEAKGFTDAAIGVLSKPFASDQFIAAVNAAIARSRGESCDAEEVSWF
jgi:DNA-binding response OmpR family regulator